VIHIQCNQGIVIIIFRRNKGRSDKGIQSKSPDAKGESKRRNRSGSGREERTVRSEAGSGEEMDEDEYETIDKAEQSRESGEAVSD